jgi:hypothetical protein
MIDLQVQQQFGRIGLKITPCQDDLSIRPPDLQVQQRSANISLTQPAATLEIDYTSALESMGYNGIAEQQRVFTQDAKASADSGIERTVSEGYQFAKINKKVSLAKVLANSMKPKEKELELVSIAPIKITVQPNNINWDAKPVEVAVDLKPGTVQVNYTSGSVHSYLEQEPYIQLQAVGNIYDQKS